MSSEPESTISQAEIAVMKIIWESQPISVREVYEAINAPREEPLTRTTILKHIQRLEAKGWLERDDGRPARYRATVSSQRAENRLLASFKELVFDGSTMSMVRSLVGGSRLSKTELAELRALIDESEKNTKKRGRK